jgi:Spy/CpxP family protein refolding chaperone
MHWTRTPRIIALALASTLALTAAYAAADSAPGTPAGAAQHNRFQQKLGLTDAQMTAIREVHSRHVEQQKQLWQSLRQAQSELRQIALNGGDVKAKTAEIAGLYGQMTELRATTLQEISPILTQEQRDAMAKMSPMGPHGHWHHGPRPSQG